MFADSTLLTLKKLKDSAGRPIWIPAAQAGQTVVGEQAVINGHGYVLNNDMAAVGAGTSSSAVAA